MSDETIDIPTVEVVQDDPREAKRKRRAERQRKHEEAAEAKRKEREHVTATSRAHQPLRYEEQLRIGQPYAGGEIAALQELCPEYPGPHVHVILRPLPQKPPPMPSQLCVRFGYEAARDLSSIAAVFKPREYKVPRPKPEPPEPRKKPRKKDEDTSAHVGQTWKDRVR